MPAQKTQARHVLYAFWAGYLLSYLFRTVNAVISPELTHELGLAPGMLGLLTSAYLISFAALQIPAGILLDRYGPRRVESALLVVAGAGALLFAFAQSATGLVVARALIGAGVCGCLMGPLKAIALWHPRERHASLGGWIEESSGRAAAEPRPVTRRPARLPSPRRPGLPRRGPPGRSSIASPVEVRQAPGRRTGPIAGPKPRGR